MATKNALLIIDPQNDFCNPGDAQGNNVGSLYVPGADKDMERLAEWIVNNIEDIDSIAVTLDTHHINDIAHPTLWEDKDGNNPNPFTIITSQDIENGTWTPKAFGPQVVKYIKDLEDQGEYPHCIWPPHCIRGTEGHAIYGPLADALSQWVNASPGKFVQYVQKGEYPLAEHFGAFRANVEVQGEQSTQLNQKLIRNLEKFQNVYFAGEAESHCVANTLKQAMDLAPDLANKFVILEDAMSVVPGFETLGDATYDQARKNNIRFSNTNDALEGRTVKSTSEASV